MGNALRIVDQDLVEAPRARGRPIIPFDQGVADFICREIASGTKGIMGICKAQKAIDPSFPGYDTVYKWLNDNDNFSEAYTRARAKQMDVMADEIVELADEPNGDVSIYYDSAGRAHAKIDGSSVQRSKLRVDTRKWVMERLAATRYGARMDITSGGERLPVPAQHVDNRVQSIVMQAMSRMAQGDKPEGWDSLSAEAQALLE